METIWTKKSQIALRSIYEYISKNNEDLAKEIIACIINVVKNTIPDYKHIGRAGKIFGTREFVLSKYPYIIVYKVKDNCLYIVRVLHASMKYPN